MFSSVEDSRLNYIRQNVQTRIAARSELDETIDAEGGPRAGRVYLPSSFMGSPRMQRKLIADGMAVVRRLGKPTYFITVTCNPNWPEIQNHPDIHGQNASDRPDLTCRIFKEKLHHILEALRNGLLGRKVYMMYVVEFQKRGLPHAHIALSVTPQPQTTEQIDDIISAETPPESTDKEDQRYRELVLRHMVHGHTKTCRDEEGHCRKKFPKPVTETTYTDDRGYTHYRRRTPQDTNIVPHNRHLLLLGEGHINVEVSCTVNLIMYLYKYIFKGPDHARYSVGDSVDEIQDYLKAKYLSASEAVWRIFGFHVNYRDPSVTPLPIHLPSREFVIFQEGNEQVAAATSVSKLQRYLCRPLDTAFDSLNYCEYFEQFIVGASRPRTAETSWVDQVPDRPHYVHRTKGTAHLPHKHPIPQQRRCFLPEAAPSPHLATKFRASSDR